MLFKSNLFWGHVRLNLTVKSNGPARMIRLVLWSLFIDSIIFMNNHSNLGVEGNHNGCDDNSSDNDDGSIGHRVVCISQTALKFTHFPSLPPQSLPSAMYMGILIPQHPPYSSISFWTLPPVIFQKCKADHTLQRIPWEAMRVSRKFPIGEAKTQWVWGREARDYFGKLHRVGQEGSH